MNDVFVSIIIPTYNRAKVIKFSIESVLNQTFQDFELIIVDDGSTDNTRDIIADYKDKRIKYIYQRNSGACAARNNGIYHANGKYIAFHDSDDIWHIDKLEKQLKCFDDKNVDIVFCKLKQYKDDVCLELPLNVSNGVVSPVTDVSGIGTQTIIAKREVFEKYKFNLEMPRYQEMELLMRAATSFTLYCLDEALVDYYISDNSISKNPEKLLKACNLILEKDKEIIKKYPVNCYFMAGELIKQAFILKQKEKKIDWQYIFTAFKLSTDVRIFIKFIMMVFDIKPERIKSKENV